MWVFRIVFYLLLILWGSDLIIITVNAEGHQTKLMYSVSQRKKFIIFPTYNYASENETLSPSLHYIPNEQNTNTIRGLEHAIKNYLTLTHSN